VRPEFVEIAPPAPGLLAANIERIDDLGRVRFARVRVGDVGFSAKVPAGFSVSGNSAGLVFDPSRVHVYADSRLVEGAG
jgi:glycerol transport system ATP-binding protein